MKNVMAQLPPYIHKTITHSKLSWRCSRGATFPNYYNIGVISFEKIKKNPSGSNYNVRIVRIIKCGSTRSEEAVKIIAGEEYDEKVREQPQQQQQQFGYLVSENGWGIRRMVETEEEMREVAKIQAEAFHEPVALFNDVFLEFFQAEVLSGLLYRLRNSPPDRYACLVAESSVEKAQQLVGVVDVTAYRDYDVLEYLPGADEYLYVSGIAVSNKFRRRKVATALLKGCDKMAMQWGFEYVVLRAHEDDLGAQKLYKNAGYRVVSADPWWVTLMGRRRRVLMIKRFHRFL